MNTIAITVAGATAALPCPFPANADMLVADKIAVAMMNCFIDSIGVQLWPAEARRTNEAG
jgi:hypothetical protein